MKKSIYILAVIAATIAALVQSGVLNAALVFLLTGAIPSTTYSIPPITMFVLMAIGLWLLFAFLSQNWIRKSIDHSYTRQLHNTVSLPRRRYSKIK